MVIALDKYDYEMMQAEACINSGFKSHASRQRALKGLNSAYSILRGKIHKELLSVIHAGEPVSAALASTVYYDYTPMDLHLFKGKHADKIISVVPQVEYLTVLALDLVKKRESVKNMPIIKKELAKSGYKTDLYGKIQKRLELLSVSSDPDLDCSEYFEDLKVSANVHLCRNYNDTVYVRVFFYLNGELTPLNTILALIQKKKEQKLKGE